MFSTHLLGVLFAAVMVIALPQGDEPKPPKFILQVEGSDGVIVRPSRDDKFSVAPFMEWHDNNVGKFDANGFVLDLNSTAKLPICTISGTATEALVVFHVKDSLDYLDHCGAYKGITLTCIDPEAACGK